MTEINSQGYQAIRDYVQANWIYIELRNAANTAITRLSTSDPRISWTHAPGAQTLQLTAVIAGSDTDITVPVTIAGSAIYSVPTDGLALSVVNFDHSFDLETADYQITINHQIQIPELQV